MRQYYDQYYINYMMFILHKGFCVFLKRRKTEFRCAVKMSMGKKRR